MQIEEEIKGSTTFATNRINFLINDFSSPYLFYTDFSSLAKF